MKRKKITSKKFLDIMVELLLLAIIVYLIIQGVRSFFPEEEKTIKFEVIGITNSTNVTTLVQLHYECIKFCGEDLAYSSSDKVSECWKECSTLGGKCK